MRSFPVSFIVYPTRLIVVNPINRTIINRLGKIVLVKLSRFVSRPLNNASKQIDNFLPLYDSHLFFSSSSYSLSIIHRRILEFYKTLIELISSETREALSSWAAVTHKGRTRKARPSIPLFHHGWSPRRKHSISSDTLRLSCSNRVILLSHFVVDRSIVWWYPWWCPVRCIIDYGTSTRALDRGPRYFV